MAFSIPHALWYNFCMRKFLHRLRNHFIPSHHNAFRPHILKKQWLIFFLTIVLTAEGVFVAGMALQQPGSLFLAAVVPGEVIAFTNTERTLYSLNNVQENILLSGAAQAKAEDMAKAGYFAHVGPDGKEPWAWIQESGYAYSYAGENLAVRFLESKDVVEAWMASPTHRANIVKQAYTEIGVGVAEGAYEGRPATFVVQYFGAPRVAVAATPAAPAEEPVTVVPFADTAVQGAATSEETPLFDPTAAPSNETLDTYVGAVVEGVTRSDNTVLWVVGGVATLLVLALGLAFFINIQVQPNDMLMGGAVVAVIAVSLFGVNSYYKTISPSSQPQAAAVGMIAPAGLIDAEAAAVTP